MAWTRRIGTAVTSVCLLTAAALVGGPHAASADPGTVMLVVKSPNSLTAGDAAVQARLVAAGHTVSRADDNTVTAAQAAAVDLVIVSSSVVDTVLESRLVGVPTPTLIAKPYLLDNYGLTGPVAGTDYGSRMASALAVVDPAHPMAAGRNGTVSFQAGDERIAWGRPVASARVAARLGTNSAVFSVVGGDPIANGQTAAGCRLVFPLMADAPTSFTADAWAMFEASVAWGVGDCQSDPPPPDPEPYVAYVAGNAASLTTAEHLVVDRLDATGYVVSVKDDTTVTPADVASAEFVIVGYTVSPSTLGSRLAGLSVPVWVAKPLSFPKFQMTGPTAGSDFGDKAGRVWAIAAPGHPLAAGRAGSFAAYTGSYRVSWGAPVPAATVVATATGSGTVFTVPAGAVLANGSTSPGCRFTFPLFGLAPLAMSADGLAMFDAAAAWGANGCDASPPPPGDGVEHVVIVSVDGLNPQAIGTLGEAGAPGLHRLMTEGASTLNARTTFERTETLPNHSSMVTGRRVDLPGGHGVSFNEDNASTIHTSASQYVTSVFDVVHDRDGSTAMYAGKPKFDFLDRSWNGTFGGPDLVGADTGRDKIDVYQRVVPGSTGSAAVVSAVNADTLRDLTFVHIREPDQAGHASGYLSAEYLAAVQQADGWIDDIMDALAENSDPGDRTVLLVTTDHGGAGTQHGDATAAVNYTIPLFAWGEGVDAGADLYDLNASRVDPGTGRPDDDGLGQPLRNGDVANLALDLLGLPPVPGSLYNADQALRLTATP